MPKKAWALVFLAALLVLLLYEIFDPLPTCEGGKLVMQEQPDESHQIIPTCVYPRR